MKTRFVTFAFALSLWVSLTPMSALAATRLPLGQQEIAEAAAGRRGLPYVEALNVVVTKILADDDEGRPHQSWVFRLANGLEVRAVYNLDTGDRIPLRAGDVISVGGELLWSKRGPLLHWLHADPDERRPDGYVLHRGERYGELDEFSGLSQERRTTAARKKIDRERRLRDPRFRRQLERLGFTADAADGALQL